ncbi:MAG: hypothetical protein NPIRA03_09650 [Nitrospirales bacterium]|nr:MAG: hypothetical protein NPIRA03_09650 [Nitrospirales bacterium]
MSCPRIFVSSTYYDLKHVREIIRKFIEDLGFEPVLSEFSDIFYQPGDTVQNSCLGEISNCDIFVLIVGKRYGSCFPGDTLSITHKEYIEAQNQSIPIYSFVDLDVLHDFEFHNRNTGSAKCEYRVVDDVKVFDLITDIQKASTNNALISFTSIADILNHLKKQWASLLKNYLQDELLKVSRQKPKEKSHENFAEFEKKLKDFIGITNLTQATVNQANSFIELVKLLGGSIVDLVTDYKITVNGSTTNVGKEVVRIFDSELVAIKTE